MVGERRKARVWQTRWSGQTSFRLGSTAREMHISHAFKMHEPTPCYPTNQPLLCSTISSILDTTQSSLQSQTGIHIVSFGGSIGEEARPSAQYRADAEEGPRGVPQLIGCKARWRVRCIDKGNDEFSEIPKNGQKRRNPCIAAAQAGQLPSHSHVTIICTSSTTRTSVGESYCIFTDTKHVQNIMLLISEPSC